jgi:hypothetical protein
VHERRGDQQVEFSWVLEADLLGERPDRDRVLQQPPR